MKNKFNLAIIVLLGAIVFWASAFADIRAGLQHFSPTSVALGRFVVASLIFVAVAFVRGIKFPKGRDLLTVAFWGGFLSISVYHFCLNTGEETVQAGVASVIVSLSPIMIAISARFLLGATYRYWYLIHWCCFIICRRLPVRHRYPVYFHRNHRCLLLYRYPKKITGEISGN